MSFALSKSGGGTGVAEEWRGCGKSLVFDVSIVLSPFLLSGILVYG